MTKWADYGISAVRYDEDDTIGAAEDRSRENVLSKMDDGKTFVTILKGEDGNWRKGNDVHIVPVDGRRFLRTDANERDQDNLENLSKY